MWFILLAVLLLFSIGGLLYLTTRFHKFRLIQSRGKKASWLIAAVCTLPFAVGLLLFSIVTTVVLLHLMLFWAICDFVGAIIRRIKKCDFRYYYQGIAAIALCVAYLCVGWYNAHYILQTDYTITTDKAIGQGLRIVLIADAHLGAVLSAERFAEEMKTIQAAEPDVVVLCGDYVDDDASFAEFRLATKALAEVKSTYGTYYVFGNHDKGYMNTRDFSQTQLRNTLTENGIKILEDECVLLGDSFWLIGRQDRSAHNRATAQELALQTDAAKYSIVLDHQPNDYDALADAGFDLVLSGHTHGGHIFPAGEIGMLLGANDMIYGLDKRDETSFVVTSGISGWAIPFKTFCASEYVVIDIIQE